MKCDQHLFFSLLELYFKKDKLELEYHISNLIMKRDLEFDDKDICRNQKKFLDFFYNLQKLIPTINQVFS